MKGLLLAMVLALAACDGPVGPQLVEAAPDGGVVATQQAIINPGYTVNWNEDRKVWWNASFDNRVALWMPGNGNLTYYFNSAHVGAQWEWSVDGMASWHLLQGVESHASATIVSTLSVGSGQRGCFNGIGCVAIPTPMVDWTVYHHQAAWDSAWVPPTIDQTLPHGPVYLRRRYVIECPTTGVYSRPFAYGTAVRLDTAPAYLNISYTSSAPASGLFLATDLWQGIATDCNYGTEAFIPKTFVECVCPMSPPTVCQQWPGQSYACTPEPSQLAFCTQRCGHG